MPDRHVTRSLEEGSSCISVRPTPLRWPLTKASMIRATRFSHRPRPRACPRCAKLLAGAGGPDPLTAVFEAEIVPMLEAAPGPAPDRDLRGDRFGATPISAPGIRRTLERRIRSWRAVHGEEQDVIFPPDA